MSSSEAYALSEFDESSIKAGYAEAVKASNVDAPETKAEAAIQISVFTSLARALNIAL